jgi:hypothetical protein
MPFLKIYDLIIVGRGTAAAAFANSLDLSKMFPRMGEPSQARILVVGKADGWAGVRGKTENAPLAPNNKINQPPHMIAQYSSTVPKFSKGGWEVMVNRDDYARENVAILTKLCNLRQAPVVGPDDPPEHFARSKIVDAEVKQVDRYNLHVGQGVLVSGFTVATAKKTYWAPNIVLATGGGPHRVPEFLSQPARNHPGLVLDMDRFSREVDKLKVTWEKNHPKQRMKVLIFGGNAAIDTVELAGFEKFDFAITWLIPEGSPVTTLDTNHQQVALNLKSQVIKYSDKPGSSNIRMQLDKTLSGLGQIQCWVGSKHLIADMVVYGLGQDDKQATKYISQNLKDELIPIFDKNQSFGEMHESVFGFCSKDYDDNNGRGVVVIGALAQSLANTVPIARAKEGYLARLGPLINRMQDLLLNADILDDGMPIDVLFHRDVGWYGRGTVSDEVIKQPVERITNRIRKYEQYDGVKQTIDRLSTLGTLIINYITVCRSFDKLQKEIEQGTRDPSRQPAKFWQNLLNNPSKAFTVSTVSSPQIGSIVSTTTSLNGHEPAYLRGQETSDVGFNQDRREILRVFIALNYPFVEDSEAVKLIEEIISSRKTNNDKWGISDQDAIAFKQRLSVLNRAGYVKAVY